MKNHRILALTIICGLLALSPAFAGSKKKTAPAAVQAPTITSVTASSVTFSEGKTAKTVGISQFTEITVNGMKGTAADLKPGMTVNVSLGTDASKATRIVATGK
jgi:hypothetical protein